MPIPASRARTVFRACVVNAVRESEALIGDLIEGTRTTLTEEEVKARDMRQRTLLGDALRELQAHDAELRKAYPTALLEIFAEGPTGPKGRAGQQADEMDISELTLMDDADVMAQVELSRAQQVVVHATEGALAELDPLVSAAQGLHNVQPESNPLRPENYIRALQQVVGETGVSGDVRQLWMRQMRERLGPWLIQSYERAAKSLREHGVEKVGYTYGAAAARDSYGGGAYAQAGYPAAAYPSGQPGLAVPSGGVPLAPEAEEALLTVGILRQMLASSGDPFNFDPARVNSALAPAVVNSALAPVTGAMPVAAAYPGGYVPAVAARAMQDMAQLEHLVGRLAGAQGAQPAPVAAGDVAATMAPTVMVPAAAVPAPEPEPEPAPTATAQEVVSRMMHNIAQDARLLPSVQQAVQSLEPALQQLVQHDTGFFSDDQHPARRLLDELTQRSLAFDSEDDSAFKRFMRLTGEAVGHLSSVEINDATPFEQVLDALEKAWAAQERGQRKRREAEQKELLQREQARLLAEKIAADWTKLPGADKVPQALMAFFTGPWADVVAREQISQPQDAQESDPNGYLALVPLLLHCAQPELLRADPRRLGDALAEMVPIVRQGLESIGHPEEQIAEALERLEQLQNQAREYAAAQPERIESETGGESQGDADLTEPSEYPDGPALRVGQWVEMVSNRRVVRTQLTWCSPRNTLFLFTAPDASSQSMTRRMINRLAAEGAFRVLAVQPSAFASTPAPRTARSRTRARR